jgi:tetratricopeptide (TPR) repeat protein
MNRTWIAIAAVAMAVAQGVRPAVVTSQQADLAALEAALSAAPDDLRAANDYRMAIIPVKQYDRSIAFFKKLTADYPNAANAHLNYGFAYVDKIPDAGAITKVILANNALGEFTKSLELRPSWIALYTRGNSYLFWPRIFNRTKYGIADLTEALKMQKIETKRHYHVRVYVSLGDGLWKYDDLPGAANIWREGLAQFPDSDKLKARLAKQGDELKTVIEADYDPQKRVDTSLQDLWMER